MKKRLKSLRMFYERPFKKHWNFLMKNRIFCLARAQGLV